MRPYKGETIVEPRTVLRLGNSHYLSLPPEFVELYNIKHGDRLPVTATDIVKVIPLSEKHLPEPEPEPIPKVRCPLCRNRILATAMASHLEKYCPKALAVAS